MKVEHLLIGFVLLLGLPSCDPETKYTEQLDEIDSSLTVIEDLEAKMDGIKFDSLIFMVDHVKSNEAKIKQYYHPDTLDESFGRLLNECKGIRKSLTNIKNQKMRFGDELNALKHQFQDLRTDIKNGVYSEEKINGYLEKEKNDLEIFRAVFMEFYENQKIQSRIYYHDVPQVDAYIEKIIAESDTIPG